ncbi:MAG: response regulator transcription factor [Chloroflexi bacterium]|jgi:PleD family two-component response regulator|nr:response regulator transcription factor [Chloroflexota bacterium]MBT7081773.1 response regulator transcription factor [Chloroflexota bacterium]MBT7289413.1 response regulator transcription factor [Chloroflexota bacterium]
MSESVKKNATREQLDLLTQDIKKGWKELLTFLISARENEARKDTDLFGEKAERSSESISILIIDDDVTSLEGIASVLGDAGFDTIIALDCIQGLMKLDDENPGLVLLSETLPNSHETCTQIHQLTGTPVIMMGSDPSDHAWERAVGLGADAYFRKSISKPELKARVKAVVSRYQR